MCMLGEVHFLSAGLSWLQSFHPKGKERFFFLSITQSEKRVMLPSL